MMSQLVFATGGGGVAPVLGEGDGQGVDEGDGVADAEGDGDGVADAEGDALADADGDTFGPGAAVGDAAADAEGDADGLGSGEATGRASAASAAQGAAGLLDEVRNVLACGTSTTTRPATTTRASIAINAGYVRLCRSSWLR
jgi:hypothetical protein